MGAVVDICWGIVVEITDGDSVIDEHAYKIKDQF
jgi:hypothetical protein